MNLPGLRKAQKEVRKKSKEKGIIFNSKQKSEESIMTNFLSFSLNNEELSAQLVFDYGFLKVYISNFNVSRIHNEIAVEYVLEIARMHDVPTVLFGFMEIDDVFLNQYGISPVDDSIKMEGSDLLPYGFYVNFDNFAAELYRTSFLNALQEYQKENMMFSYSIHPKPNTTINHANSMDYLLFYSFRYRNNYYDSSLLLYAKDGQFFIEDTISSKIVNVSQPDEISKIIKEMLQDGLLERRLAHTFNPELIYLKEKVFYSGKLHEEAYTLVKEFLLNECNIDSEEIEFAVKHKLFVSQMGRMTHRTPFVYFLHIVDKNIVITEGENNEKSLRSFDSLPKSLEFLLTEYGGEMDNLQPDIKEKYEGYVTKTKQDIELDFVEFIESKKSVNKVKR